MFSSSPRLHKTLFYPAYLCAAVFPQYTKPIRPKLLRINWLKTHATFFPRDKNATETRVTL